MPRLLVSLVGALALLVNPVTAHAQACCGGASAITPGRLELHERAIFGLFLLGSGNLGSYDAAGGFREMPPGAAEVDTRSDFVGAVRWLERGQLSIAIPLHASWRRASTTGAELGGGLGDVNLGVRYDLVNNREMRYLPGIALLGGVTVPTGRAPEGAQNSLGSDATGTGAAQVSIGLALERSFGDFLVNVTGLAAKRAPRDVSGVESELGTELTGLLAVGYTIVEGTAAALVVTYMQEGDARVAGRDVPDTASRRLRGSVAASTALNDSWRFQASVFVDPPVDGVGRNQLSALGGTFASIWSFL